MAGMEEDEEARVVTGRVAKWLPEKGFGWITRDDTGSDIFCHHSEVAQAAGGRGLLVGEPVQFMVRDREGREAAYGITALGGGPVIGMQGGGKGQPQAAAPVKGKGKGGKRGPQDLRPFPGGGQTRGKVVRFFQQKGYAFVQPFHGDFKDVHIYAHHSAWGGGNLAIGWEVSFDVEADPRSGDGKLRAVHIAGPAVLGRGLRSQKVYDKLWGLKPADDDESLESLGGGGEGQQGEEEDEEGEELEEEDEEDEELASEEAGDAAAGAAGAPAAQSAPAFKPY
eukprot:TRINITY_DN10563_c0_g1_i1.p1 TRINITY_DN10563_c0_g1~~TRINITY_DN10563_c0_g1_i1.p1  ORF type:complete len:304 (+),score=113.95 TRINITY_DN10563_c0_g1_i1:72-914(+)